MYKYGYIVECRLTLKNIYLLGDAPLSKTEILFLYIYSFITSHKKLVKKCVDYLIMWKNHVNAHSRHVSRYNLSFKYQCVTNSSLSEEILIIPRFCEILYAFSVLRRSVLSYLPAIAAGIRNYRVCIALICCLVKENKMRTFEYLNK